MPNWQPIDSAPKDTMVRVRPGRDPAPYEFARLRPEKSKRWRTVTDNWPLSPTEWAPAD